MLTDLLKKYSNFLIVGVFAYFLFFHIKDNEYSKMMIATLITAVIICQNNKNVEGLTNNEINTLRSMDSLSGYQEIPTVQEYAQQNEKVSIKPFNSTTRMGPYDGLCINSENAYVKNELIPNNELSVYFGVQGPLENVQSDTVSTGTSVDGDENTKIKKKAMFSNNKINLNCCDSSPYSTSNGCVCVTDKQRKFIRSRGHNKTSPDMI